MSLASGQSTTVEFTLTPADLSFIGRDNKRVSERGRFRVAVDTLTDEFEIR